MKIIKQKITINRSELNPKKLMNIEAAARVCYKSEGSMKATPNVKFLQSLIRSGHESVLEHEKITVKITTSRALTHQIVRHRLASYSQESTRYCDYSNDKRFSDMEFIAPFFSSDDSFVLTSIWQDEMERAERKYKQLIANGAKPEEARGVLPHDLKTEIVMTMNVRSWRHFLKLRMAKDAQPQIQHLAQALFFIFKSFYPVLFDDLGTIGDFSNFSPGRYVENVIIDDEAAAVCPMAWDSTKSTTKANDITLGAALDMILSNPDTKLKNTIDGGVLYYSPEDERVMYELFGIDEIFTVSYFDDRRASFIVL